MTENKEIKVYYAPGCHKCDVLKSYLNGHGISYTSFDITRDEKAEKEMVLKSDDLRLPQIDICGTMIVGFDRESIDEELKKNNLL